jgi:hypothetical protein
LKIEQKTWSADTGWVDITAPALGASANLVLAFAAPQILRNRELLADIKLNYPHGHIFGCSTAGEILDTRVSDNTLVTTAVHFEHTRLKFVKVNLDKMDGNSYQAGAVLAQSLAAPDLVHVFVLSDGISVNGSELAKGLVTCLPEGVSVTGGLAGDGDRFNETIVLYGDTAPEKGTIAGLGLYGKRLKVGYGSFGGWDPFGPERLVTKSKANILYELDGRSALELYKEYLGDHAKGLPATGLLFPLNVRIDDKMTPLVRTILAVNEKEQSMTFAGDIPEGAYARLMKANFDRLIDGAAAAAKTSHAAQNFTSPGLAILISCVGRKLVLRQRTEEEVEAVRDVLGKKTALTGFYSYGELCPSAAAGKCELHNQTMTITTLIEI